MLIDINPKRWEEIKAELEDRGKLSRTDAVRGKLIQFPEPVIEPWDICVGSDN
jgi:hypothetical protein